MANEDKKLVPSLHVQPAFYMFEGEIFYTWC